MHCKKQGGRTAISNGNSIQLLSKTQSADEFQNPAFGNASTLPATATSQQVQRLKGHIADASDFYLY